ncbi:hypothetical protein BH10PSE19_BH10PSE19_02750 [soil metagenome]
MHRWRFLTFLLLCIPLLLWAQGNSHSTLLTNTIEPALNTQYAGLVLITLSLIFLIAEAFIPTFGVIGFIGISAFVAGSILLLHTGITGYVLALLIIMALINIAFFLTVVNLALLSRKQRIVSGREALLAAVGTVKENFTDQGWIQVEGESWQAHSNIPLHKGDKVRITAMDGLILTVKPLEKDEA